MTALVSTLDLVHADIYILSLEDDDFNELREKWFYWKGKHKDLCKGPIQSIESINLIARRVQAWHILCAITEYIKDLELFNIHTKEPMVIDSVEDEE